ncbi:desmoglein-2-like [Heterodontus francisci]|uniref:desmoglein-2-like n=1 Tax=Heterodontus francisci TaxID=7792 RepID=UPI00355BFF9F
MPRNILCLLLFMVYSQTGQCCEKRFSKNRFDAVVPAQISKGVIILTVKFHHCNLGDRIKLITNDDNFGIHSNGSVYATHTQSIDSKYHFKVLAEDLKTYKVWKANIHLISSAKDLPNKRNEVIKRKCPVIYFPKVSKSKRQKREWIIPPVAVREHEPPMNNPIAVIRSDYEKIVSPLFYTITGPGANQPPTNLFVIDQHTGELNITGMVDREKNPYFTLKGQAVDGSGAAVESPLSLVIEILDINDNVPVFTQQVFEGSVEELSPMGTLVLKLLATDADKGKNAQIAYRILSQGSNNMFIAKSNGEIRTWATNLDRESQDLYTLTVEGRDLNGNASGLFSKANAQIRILDVNDNIPTVEKEEYEVVVEENSLNDEVTRIKVFDRDQEFTDNWLGHFNIIEGNEGGHFRFEVDEQTNEGILILQKELDYEKIQTKNLVIQVANKAAYHTSVITGGGGGGGGFNKPIRIKVNVQDKKEGFLFKPTTKRIHISEDRTKVTTGQSLGNYPAISADTGKESERTSYAKDSDPANFFNINPDTGEITLAKLPDRESEHVVDGKYTATILAIDNDGSTPKTATGTIVFDVDDANDNIPIISNLQSCMCDKAKSLTLTAFDADSYPNAAPYHYKLAGEPGITEQWKILHKDDTSAELQPLMHLWPHTFKVPIKVEDNKGSGKVQNVDVKVIECTDDDLTCSPENMRQIGTSKAALGAPAAGLIALGALLLLLAPLLLLFCKCGGAGGGLGTAGVFKQIPIEPQGHLEKDNIEGGGQADTSVPLLPVDSAGAMTHQTISGAASNGRLATMVDYVGGSANINSGAEVGHGFGQETDIRDTNWIGSNANPPMEPAVAEFNEGTISGGSFQGYMGAYINEKLNDYSEEDQTRPARDCLLVYNHEGEGSPVGSIGSCSFIEDEPQFKDSYLDDLGPKFKTLADICVGNFESQTSTIRADPPVQQNFARTERSISSSSGGLHSLNIITDPPLVQKNYVVTTTINPVTEILPGIADPSVTHQNVVMTKQVNASAGGIPAMMYDPSIAHQNVVMTKQVNASAGGIPAMMYDPSIAHQNVVMTKQVHASAGGIPAMMYDPSVTHQNVVMTKQVNASAGGIPAMMYDPSIAHQNVVMTKQVNASAGGIPGMMYDPSVTHQNVVMTKQVNASAGGIPAMMYDPSIAHQNVVMTKQVNASAGGTQGMIADLSLAQTPVVHKNVILNKSIHYGTGATQSMIADPSLDQIPVIHKNVTLTRPAHTATGVAQGSNFANESVVQKSRVTRKSVTSPDHVHKTVTKVTKVTEVMQE